MVDLNKLAALIDTVDGVADVESAERTLYRERSAELAEIPIALGAVVPIGAEVKRGSVTVTQTKSEDDHALDGMAHHIFNTLRTLKPGPSVVVPRGRTRDELLAMVPVLLDVEIEWRIATKTNATLAATLVYWENGGDTLDLNSPGWQRILLTAAKHLPALAAALPALLQACTETIPGPATSLLEEAGLGEATCDDVRTVLQGRGK